MRETTILPFFFVAGCLVANSVFGEQTIKVGTLAAQPTVDGMSADWATITATTVPLTGSLDLKKVDLKTAVFKDNVYFLLQWQDTTKDEHHKPYIWNDKKKKYDKGSQKEDRLAIQFAMTGEYSANWFSGKPFTADTWHWKSARTNPLGLAQDKMTVVLTDKVKKAYKKTLPSGTTIYIQRPADKGSRLYKTKRYRKKDKDIMPKYVMVDKATGSIADVKAKGVWANNQWTLEMQRQLNTGNADDAIFTKGQAIKGAIAVFDRSGDENHNISDTLVFAF
jgi:hypothetical protein